ncbi:uncharacterized protein B0H64DRAFT_14799 [Chaetomium fimeti]|uniref:Uncharacterized protein n=1 Tax=Chaetomium fimeti TaxID=1854472 RepID=A0AAE0HQ65_9PEZI|nr:hypothetical protein B0H64DRAFT_14799 [Chaetomium fimeti]
MFEKLSVSILGDAPADAPYRMWKGLRAEGWDAGPLWSIQCFSWEPPLWKKRLIRRREGRCMMRACSQSKLRGNLVEAARGRKVGKEEKKKKTKAVLELAERAHRQGKLTSFLDLESGLLAIQQFRRTAPVLGICSLLIFTFWAFSSLVWGIAQNSLLGAARHHCQPSGRD